MGTTTKFCLPEDVKAHLHQNDGYTGDDDYITTHIKQATALIRSYTRRNMEQDTFIQYFDTWQIQTAFNLGRAVARFTLKERPVQSITSVKFHTGGEWDDTKKLDTELYSIDGNSLIMYPYEMHYHQRSLQVIYVAGYPVNENDEELLDVPENIKQACAIQAANTWRRVLNETSGKNQKQDKQGFAIYAVSSAGLVKEALALMKTETVPLVGR